MNRSNFDELLEGRLERWKEEQRIPDLDQSEEWIEILGTISGVKLREGDVIGCGVNLTEECAFFTHNGRPFGK